MIYSMKIPKKYFNKVRELCKGYSSYRECVMKEIEKKYNFPIYNSRKPHDTRLEDDLLPKPIFIIFYDRENERLEELSKRLGKSKYEIVMSLFR